MEFKINFERQVNHIVISAISTSSAKRNDSVFLSLRSTNGEGSPKLWRPAPSIHEITELQGKTEENDSRIDLTPNNSFNTSPHHSPNSCHRLLVPLRQDKKCDFFPKEIKKTETDDSAPNEESVRLMRTCKNVLTSNDFKTSVV